MNSKLKKQQVKHSGILQIITRKVTKIYKLKLNFWVKNYYKNILVGTYSKPKLN